MSDDGTTFTIDVATTGQTSVDAMSASTDVLAARLDAASKAVKVGEAAYQGIESRADKAAKALERVGLAAELQRAHLKAATDVGDAAGVERATAKLRDLEVEQGVLATRATKAKTALLDEAKAFDALKASAAKAEDAVKAEEKAKAEAAAKVPKESGSLEDINFAAVSRGLNKFGGPLGEVGGKVAGLGAGFKKLSSVFGTSAAAAVIATVVLVALAAAIFAIGVKIVESTIKVAAWAVSLADTARSASLLAQGIARSVEGGALLDDKISDLTKTLPLTRTELEDTAKKLADAGYRGKDLAAALETAATKAAKLKFGPDFAEQMLSLDEQSKVFKANVAGVFGGLKIEGLLGALQKMVGLFDEGTASGNAIKVVFESIFQPLIDGLSDAEPKIERFFLEFEILVLKALIAVKPFGSTILKVVEMLLIGGAVIAAVLGGVVLVAIVGILGALTAIVLAVGAIAYGFYKAGSAIVGGIGAAIDWLKSINLTEIGKAMMSGLVSGIVDGAKAVTSAITGAVSGAIDAAKKLLDIHSPSKVFAEIGMQTGAGMALGVEASAPGVQASLENMVQPPSVPAAGAGSSASGASSGAGTVYNFVLNGVAGADDAVERISEIITRLAEGDAAQLGAAVPG
jgi:hypothetical protein